MRPEIRDAFDQAAKIYPFRVVSAPFEADSDHLRLLDWAVREADITDWFVTQHCDLFWRDRGWLPRLASELDPALTVVCTPCPSPYCNLTAFFRIADSVRRAGSHLSCDFTVGLESYARYSYLTSFCIERAEAEDVALPWRWFERLARLYGKDVSEAAALGEWLRTYSQAREVVGRDGLGVETVDFNGTRLSTRTVKLA